MKKRGWFYHKGKKVNCVVCGEEFITGGWNSIVCSKKCRHKRTYQQTIAKIGKNGFNKLQRELRMKRNEKKLNESKNTPREEGWPEGIEYHKPINPIKDGYGYHGVLLADKKTGQVQCHVCGGWFDWLQNHIRGSHKMKADEYREQFGLGYTTALCSEKVRNLLVKRAMTYPWERMYKKGQLLKKMSQQGRNHNEKWWKRNHSTDEEKNRNGTCYLQLIDRMEQSCNRLGRQPYAHEMKDNRGVGFRKSVMREFGSVKEMRDIMDSRGYEYLNPWKRKKYSDDNLLQAMRKFADIYGRKPSYSDAKMGVMPSQSVYEKRFGSWTKAKLLAFAKT